MKTLLERPAPAPAIRLYKQMMDSLPDRFGRDPDSTQSLFFGSIALGVAEELQRLRRDLLMAHLIADAIAVATIVLLLIFWSYL